ncbi:hypothetical protein HK103_005279 [Boothiomyces macroporosus]|uniref:Uncharacterized protein n=1 Tax=Boothiomyces macroporosus TaxID=261099 RepID=A0AAD5UBM4_9FUNG|nr:hypothetical protein HK103_000316 [Boothiomyces macroporosus]KAJ3256536.1 hypothetical protein HK103_005279 [Boothiomyces macroporosus]
MEILQTTDNYQQAMLYSQIGISLSDVHLSLMQLMARQVFTLLTSGSEAASLGIDDYSASLEIK